MIFLACFKCRHWDIVEGYLINKYKIEELKSRILEPFYVCLENEKPWSLHLYGKKVLVINPFVNSFQKQLSNGFKFFKDKNIFHPEQDLFFINHIKLLQEIIFILHGKKLLKL